MPRRPYIAAALAISALLAAGVAQGAIFQQGNLRIQVSGGLVPSALPRVEPAPVSVKVRGEISTTDGSAAPPLKAVRIELNRHGRLTTRGLPACNGQFLQSTTSDQALAACRSALVGRGKFRASISFPNLGPVPAQGPVLAFNGKSHGRKALLLHLYIATPARFTFVFTLNISHNPKGEFGTVLAARIPTLAGGAGAVSEIDLKLGRNYSFEGRRMSYLKASCAAPVGFPGAPFTFARGSFHFADQRTIQTNIDSACTVR